MIISKWLANHHCARQLFDDFHYVWRVKAIQGDSVYTIFLYHLLLLHWQHLDWELDPGNTLLKTWGSSNLCARHLISGRSREGQVARAELEDGSSFWALRGDLHGGSQWLRQSILRDVRLKRASGPDASTLRWMPGLMGVELGVMLVVRLIQAWFFVLVGMLFVRVWNIFSLSWFHSPAVRKVEVCDCTCYPMAIWCHICIWSMHTNA